MGNLFSSPASPPGSPVSARASPPGTDALSQVEFGQGQGSASGGTGNASKKKKEKGKKGGEVVNFGLLILESLVALFKLLLVLSELKVPPRHGLARQIILSAVGIFLLHHVIAYFCLAEVHWLSPAVPFLEEKYAAFTDTVQALLAEGLRTLKTSLRVGAVPE
ncbi:phosphatidylserine decarboxylase, variant [Pseudohyphozyma bogoriensis]|nr:phosphatidylserine decarboxylase, variant [Pseudohyphozyma bogoriensis]